MKPTSNILEKTILQLYLPAARHGASRCGGKCIAFGMGVLMLLSFSTIHAQQEKNYAVYANIIYRFTKYIDWPAEKKSGDFIIGVVGDTPLMEELKKSITDKIVGNQKIVIKRFSSSASSFNCHILFISDDENRSIKKIVSGTAGTSTLLVSESSGLAQKGSCINFIIESDRLKLEINKNNIEDRNLNIASELLQLGKIVK
ncbi:MAG: YfiR family protein [Bacteroidia bacterium]|nr:YfiR family protein [Bacteroidia bacterium]